jgi:hypothetical protein
MAAATVDMAATEAAAEAEVGAGTTKTMRATGEDTAAAEAEVAAAMAATEVAAPGAAEAAAAAADEAADGEDTRRKGPASSAKQVLPEAVTRM